jgi:hypothetical protein
VKKWTWKAKEKQQRDSCRMDMEVSNMAKCAGWIWKVIAGRNVTRWILTDKRSVHDGYLRQQWAAGSRMDAEGNRWDAVCKCIWKAAVGRSGQNGDGKHQVREVRRMAMEGNRYRLEYEDSSSTELCRMAMEGSSSTELCRMYMKGSSSTELFRMYVEGNSSIELRKMAVAAPNCAELKQDGHGRQ